MGWLGALLFASSFDGICLKPWALFWAFTCLPSRSKDKSGGLTLALKVLAWQWHVSLLLTTHWLQQVSWLYPTFKSQEVQSHVPGRWKARGHAPPPRTTSKLKLNYREISLDNHWKTSWTGLIRIYRKSHVNSGWRGKDLKMLAMHQCVGIGNLEGYLSWRSSSRGVRGLNSMLGLLVQSTSAEKRNPYNIWLCKSTGIPSTLVRWETAGDSGDFLKDQCTKSDLKILKSPCSCRRMTVQKGLGRQPPMSLC